MQLTRIFLRASTSFLPCVPKTSPRPLVTCSKMQTVVRAPRPRAARWGPRAPRKDHGAAAAPAHVARRALLQRNPGTSGNSPTNAGPRPSAGRGESLEALMMRPVRVAAVAGHDCRHARSGPAPRASPAHRHTSTARAASRAAERHPSISSLSFSPRPPQLCHLPHLLRLIRQRIRSQNMVLLCKDTYNLPKHHVSVWLFPISRHSDVPVRWRTQEVANAE
jgi:hypothetical protein